jgi:hypothetical protein
MANPRERSGGWISTILRDGQFWIPVAVLVGGLILLSWIT